MQPWPITQAPVSSPAPALLLNRVGRTSRAYSLPRVQIAGALYGEAELPREWLAMLRRGDAVEKVAVELLGLAQGESKPPAPLDSPPLAAAPHPATGA